MRDGPLWTVAMALRRRQLITLDVLNRYRREHLPDSPIVLNLLEIRILVLFVIVYSLLVPSLTVIDLHLGVLEVLHAFLLLESTVGCNCRHDSSLLSRGPCCHIFQLIRPERHIERIRVAITHDVAPVSQAPLWNFVAPLETMTSQLTAQNHHIVVVLT